VPHKLRSLIIIIATSCPCDQGKTIVNISPKASHTHRRNLRMLQLLWKMQLQIQYTPVELRPHEYVPEEPAKFHAQDVIRRKENPTKY
jgi:hypothetical protein